MMSILLPRGIGQVHHQVLRLTRRSCTPQYLPHPERSPLQAKNEYCGSEHWEQSINIAKHMI